jgi:hypothetical protein
MFDPAQLMQVFEAHGLAVRAYRSAIPSDTGFACGFVAPDELVLDSQAQTAQIVVEYATADVTPPLSRGTALSIGGKAYRVNAAPRARGDGTFSTVTLEVAGP